jgi:uncharacterized protein YdgA (DUF945 family)
VKKITALVLMFSVIVLGALAGLPYWFGRQAENTYAHTVQRLSNDTAWQLVNKQYERGWLNSSAETVIRYPGLPLEFTALHKISHGPIPLDRVLIGDIRLTPIQAQVTSRISLAIPGAAESQVKSLALIPPLQADTAVLLNGNGRIHFKQPAVNRRDQGATDIAWGGLNGNLEFDRHWKKFKFDLTAPRLALTTTSRSDALPLPGSLSLTNLNIRSDLEAGQAGYHFGENMITVALLEVGSGFQLRDLKFSTQARPRGEYVDLTLTYQAKEINLAGKRYGPGFLAMEARKLDVALLGKFENDINELYQKNLPEEQVSLMVLGKTLELITGLAKKAPELEITKLSLKVGREEINGNAKLVLDGRRSNISENPMLLLTALSGRAELRVPRGLLRPLLEPMIIRDISTYRANGALSASESAKLTPEAMERIIDQALPHYVSKNELTRLLVPDGDHYKIIAAIKRGQFLVNNEPWRAPLIKLP